MTSAIKFVKAEANGNDFLIVDAAVVGAAQRPEFTRAICNRNCGVGADGVEFVQPRGDGFALALHNADGGEAEISGNGTRCVAAFYARHGFSAGTLHTAAGPRMARVLADGIIELGMGRPTFGADVDGHTVVSMGNPHCCVFDLPDHGSGGWSGDWPERGRGLEADPRFPRRTNVEFIRVLGRHRIEIRIFERGVGPTQSSGTGSCAAAVAALRRGLVTSPVEVSTTGGTQTVAWAGADAPVLLTGPAKVVAEGVFFFTTP